MQRMKLEGEDPNLFGPSNRRREPRLPLTFPIEVSGLDRAGHFFTEQSSCSDVGEASCAFRLRADMEEDAVVAIRSFHWQNHNVLDSRPVLFQVVRIENEETQAGGKMDERGESIVAVVRLEPAQPRRNRGAENIERPVS